MRNYSLSKLKLDLNSIVGSSECSHAKGKVTSLGQSVTARYVGGYRHSNPDCRNEVGSRLDDGNLGCSLPSCSKLG